MRRLTFALLLITTTFFNIVTFIQAVEIMPTQKEPAEAGKTFTAIDAVEAIFNGSSDKDLVALLMEKRGSERSSSAASGYTDEQLILSLLTETINAQNGRDENKAERFIVEGNRCFQTGRYDQAAREYTLAMQFAPENYASYKARADAYLQYLHAKLQAQSKNEEATKRALFDRGRTLLCKAINADYAKALALNDAIQKSNRAYLLSKKSNLSEKDQGNDPISYYEKGQRTADMLRLRGIYQAQRKTIQTIGELRKSLERCRDVCENKDGAAQ